MSAQQFPVEYGHVLMFARSIGDTNPIYSDPEYAKNTELGGIIAPPTFVQAGAQFNPNYGLRPHPDRPWHGSGKNPSGLSAVKKAEKPTDGAPSGDKESAPKTGGSGLHAEQHYEYHRPLRVGDVLTSTTKPGESWEKEGRRAGKLLFSESVTEYRDQNGELVVTARSVGVRTERPVES